MNEIDDIVSRAQVSRSVATFEDLAAYAKQIECDRDFLLAEITKLTAALADAEARGRLATFKEVTMLLGVAARAADARGGSGDGWRFTQAAEGIRIHLGYSPEDGKQPCPPQKRSASMADRKYWIHWFHRWSKWTEVSGLRQKRTCEVCGKTQETYTCV